ncbi:penicillin-binding transpeptidase domain-containing protein [Paucilactobacillus sp. N302-9]
MNNRPKRTNSSKTVKNRKIFGQWLFFLSIGLFIILGVRFAYIGIFKDVQNVNLKNRAEKLYTQQHVIQAKRGTIYDANNNAIAEDTNTYTIYAVIDKNQKSASGKPLYVTNKQRTAEVLSKYLGLSQTKIREILTPSKPNTFQVEFGSVGANISIATKQKIESANLNGINFIATPSREYPNGKFASQLIGLAQPMTNKKNQQTSLVGQMGIEKALNSQLTGVNGIKKSKTDTSGYQINDSQQISKKVKNGNDVYTTLDNKLQTLLENSMDAAYKSSQSESMNAMVMNAKTGEIVAATQRPTFNSDTKSGIEKLWRNTLIEDTYEPGSTMKVFSLSAAIDSGHFNPNGYYHSGTYAIGGGQVTDWDQGGWGSITYKEGFFRSSNVAMAHLEQLMGAKTWKTYLNKFGFFEPVKVGLGTEASGATPFKGTLEQANTAFGQGITVTAVQMMQGFSAIANNGTMLKPYFISKIKNPTTGKTIKSYHKKVVGHPITKSTAKKVRQYMQGVIYSKVGTGGVYEIPGYRIAGKTGTAQIGSAHGYESGATNYIYSFVGMAPAKNPQYVMYITMKKPKSRSQVAEKFMSPVFQQVMKQALDEHKAQSSSQVNFVKVPKITGKQVNKAQLLLTDKKLQPVVLGADSQVLEQSFAADQSVLQKSRIFVKTSGQMTMPDLSGWSKSDVDRFANFTGLKLTQKGSGFVKDQSIKSGTVFHKNQTISVTFESK